MISFYPGPSRVHDEIPKYVRDAHQKGMLSMNHRSDEFMMLYEKTVSLLKEKLEIPNSYSVFFTSSATECWEIIAQSLIKEKSIHLYNGAFGEKWFQYTRCLHPDAQGISFPPASELKTKELKHLKTELICLTQNETSNGTQLDNRTLALVKKNNPDSLVAVDATSSMAGIYLNFSSADVWFASVQKCFGLPAGLAVLICSPRAMRCMQTIGEKNHYNSLTRMKAMMDRWQTTHTPNVLGIYMLLRVLQRSSRIRTTHKKTEARARDWIKVFKFNPYFTFYIENPAVQSFTVMCLTGKEDVIADVKKRARTDGFILGKGYGTLKKETFRIANFPALKDKEIIQLHDFFNSYTYKRKK